MIFIVYCFFRFIIHDFVFGHDIAYKLSDDKFNFEIREILNLKKDLDKTNYYFNIKVKKRNFTFKIYADFNKDMKIIKEIKYYKDSDFECLLPIFKDNKDPIDMMCYYKNDLYFNYNLPKRNVSLDKFVSDLKGDYDDVKWFNNKRDSFKYKGLTVYSKNILANHYMAVDNYKGITLVNNRDRAVNVKLFFNDVYKSKLKYIIDDNYVIADYNKQYDFNQFYVVNIVSGNVDKVVFNYDISFDAYVNGTNNGLLYLVDRENKLQYAFDVFKKDINIVGDVKRGTIIYDNGQKKIMSMSENNIQEYKFKLSSKNNKEYVKIDYVLGYCYFYERDNNIFRVYKSPIENIKKKIYLFDTDNLETINYVNDYIYFRKGNDILYFHDSVGVKTLVTDREYEFNKDLKYYVYRGAK